MGKLKLFARNWVKAFIYPRPLLGLFYLPRFFMHWAKYARNTDNKKACLLDIQPCLGDWSEHTPFDAHYFYQGAWLARRIRIANTERHVDIGSSVLTLSVLSGFVETTFVDYRALQASLPGLNSIAGNILDLPFANDTVSSLSCLHVIEHIGLGRYGDPIDPQGSEKAARELQRITNTGGRLYLSLPVGRERVCFNAHRVHAPVSVLGMFSQMKLEEFSYVDDDGRYHEDKPVESASHLEYGCGLFQFVKL